MRFYLAVFIAVIFAIESHAATGEKSPPSGSRIDWRTVARRLVAGCGAAGAPPQPVAKPQATKEIEDSLKASTPLRGFGAGANPASQSLARVQSSMQQAQSLLTQPGADGKTGDGTTGESGAASDYLGPRQAHRRLVEAVPMLQRSVPRRSMRQAAEAGPKTRKTGCRRRSRSHGSTRLDRSTR